MTAISALLDDAARRDPSRIALAWGEQEMSYGALTVAVDRLAERLSVLITRGERVAVVAPNSPALVVSLFAVFMPVPIALDVMYAAQLQNSGVASGYVMLFLMTLGTYSIIPTIYLWREVSRRLAVILFAFFWLLGFGCALLL